MSVHSSVARQVVFVPEIGFRPVGTRALVESVRATVDGTSVTIVAVAAGADRTDLLAEWEPPEEPDRGKWLLKIDRSGVEVAPSAALEIALIVGEDAHAPIRTEHRFRSASGYELRELTFPGLPADTEAAELRVTRGEDRWRVLFRLGESDFVGTPVLVEIEHEGITLRATALARRRDEVAVALEARTLEPRAYISQIGSGGPSPYPPKLRRGPKRKIAEPLVLEDDQGRRSDELRRLHHFSRIPDEGSADRWPRRITSIFAVPHPGAKSPVLTVPSILIGEQTDPVVVDLRTLPLDVELGAHRLRVLRTEVSPKNPPRTRIVFEFSEPAGPRHFLGPGSLLAQGMPADMSIRGEPDDQQLMWIDTIVPDAPIVTLAGGIVRVDGPWTLPLSLD